MLKSLTACFADFLFKNEILSQRISPSSPLHLNQSGSFLLNAAIAQNADIFITADYKYHQFFDADSNIVIADIGHFESEQYTTDLIVRKLKEKFSTFAVHFTEVSTNPVNYL